MRVTVVVSPLTIKNYLPWYFPAGPGYIAAALREKHDVKVLELTAQPKSEVELENWVKTDDSELYCVSGLVTNYAFIKQFAALVKEYKKDAVVVAGGSIASSMSHLLVKNPNIDCLVIDEGDITIKELADAIENKKPWYDIKGIQYMQEERVIETPKREICDINELPMPAYDLFPVEVYLKNTTELPITDPNLSMVTARGCPFNCSFCFHSISAVRHRTVDKIMEELNYLIKTYKIKGIIFVDEMTTVNKPHMLELCKRIKETGITWGCVARVDKLDEEMLMAMKDSKCAWINVGVESANQKVLNRMRKGITVEQADKAVELCKKIGILICPNFIFGMPGETEQSIQDLVDFYKRHDLPFGTFFTATPLPGSELWDIAKKKGFIKDEEKFISETSDIWKFRVNFTDWTDEEFLKKKCWVEKTIKKNYYRKHPLIFIKDKIIYLYSFKRVIKRKGLVGASKHIIDKIKGKNEKS